MVVLVIYGAFCLIAYSLQVLYLTVFNLLLIKKYQAATTQSKHLCTACREKLPLVGSKLAKLVAYMHVLLCEGSEEGQIWTMQQESAMDSTIQMD